MITLYTVYRIDGKVRKSGAFLLSNSDKSRLYYCHRYIIQSLYYIHNNYIVQQFRFERLQNYFLFVLHIYTV